MLLKNMTALAALAFLLALMPLLAAIIFRSYMVTHKQKQLEDEIKRLNCEKSEYLQNRGGLTRVHDLIQAHFRWRSLLFPSVICSLLYAAGFTFCLAYANKAGNPDSPASWFLPDKLLNENLRLVLFTFLGVYLFNLGTLIRRVYLIDLTEQVFWGAINRLLLSMGLAVAIPLTLFSPPAAGAAPASHNMLVSAVRNNLEIVFFSMGFLANVFLDWVLEMAMHISSIATIERKDFSLRMVRGINIWKEFRLEEEGIENAQNLATADVLDLAIKTHYPIRTLIDWVDQSILICRFGEKSKDLEGAGLNVSAIELAWLAPAATGRTDVVQAIQSTTAMKEAFIIAQLNSLYEDAHVRELWTLWQRKPEFNSAGTVMRMQIKPVPPPHHPDAEDVVTASAAQA